MITIAIPAFGELALAHLVLDYNGTLAVDGSILDGVPQRLAALADHLAVHVVTGNTYGDASERLAGVDARVICLEAHGQAQAKRQYVEHLGTERTVAIGNGRNDSLMLEAAVLGIAVLGAEGAALQAITAADILVQDIVDGLELLLQPKRMIASLRA